METKSELRTLDISYAQNLPHMLNLPNSNYVQVNGSEVGISYCDYCLIYGTLSHYLGEGTPDGQSQLGKLLAQICRGRTCCAITPLRYLFELVGLCLPELTEKV